MTETAPAESKSKSVSDPGQRDWIDSVAAVLLAVSLIVRLLVNWKRAYVQDDFFWAYTAWLRSGPGVPNRDYYLANFTPLSELAAPLFRAFPESLLPMQIARGLFYVVGVVLIIACYRLTRTLGASPGWSLAAANVLSWQHHIIQRISDIRSDQVMAIFLVSSITTILRNARHAGIAGLLFGLGVATSYKIGVVGPLMLGLVILSAGRREWLRAAVKFSIACVIPPLAYFGTRIWIDGWPIFVAVWQELLGAMQTGASSRFVTFAGSFRFGALPWMFIILGAIGLAHPTVDDPATTKRRQLFTAFVILFTVTYVSLNPFIYPYNLVILMPIYAALIAGVPGVLERVSTQGRLTRPTLAIVSLAAVLSGLPATIFVFRATNETQENVMRWLWQATAKSDAVFDWQGIHVGRPGIFHWWHYSGLQNKYESGWYSVEKEIRERQVKTILINYRLNGLFGRDRHFVQNNFVEVDTCILAPGWTFRPEDIRKGMVFEAFLDSEVYRAQGASLDGVFIDGRPIRELQRIRRGFHNITAAPGAPLPSPITLFYTTRAREQTQPPCLGRGLVAWYL